MLQVSDDLYELLTYAHVCSRMRTYADAYSRMFTYAHVCSRMQVSDDLYHIGNIDGVRACPLCLLLEPEGEKNCLLLY
jgi:hypothetical protein